MNMIRDQIKSLEAEVDRLAVAMRESPMNKVFQDHTGHRFLGTHSTAWADRSREWIEARKRLSALKAKRDVDL